MSLMKKILIANRGQIACRIIRTAKRLGIKTVAIYSDIDRNSKFVDNADQAFRVGSNLSSQSYLNSEKILQIAMDSNCQALHPGFGFLSQNAIFAKQCVYNGVIFIGPPPSAIFSMGSKSQSKNIMTEASVPVVPGYHGENQQKKILMEQAEKIGYPVLIKAVLGGGGKGMRIVSHKSQFLQSLESCQRESLKAFKDDRVLIQKYIKKPRHIEVQIFGDQFGNYVHLYERDCSIQRRHQKVVEQAPSNITEKIRQSICKSAVDAAKAVGYYNAGTVQFIFDLESNQHYFMQMNTRLQVQHPISQMITGLDFVEWQMLVASGKKLPKKQQQIEKRGHAIEVRVYAQDPFNNFLPNHGTLKYFKQPLESQGVRIETGVRKYDTISTFYDPMIAKLITYGKSRSEAIQLMGKALSQYRVIGLSSNLQFLKRVISDPVFNGGDYDTGYIEQNMKILLKKDYNIPKFDLISAAIIRTYNKRKNLRIPQQLINYRNVRGIRQKHNILIKQTSLQSQLEYQCELELINAWSGVAYLNSHNYPYEFRVKDINILTITIDNHVENKQYFYDDDIVHLMNGIGDKIGFLFKSDHLKQYQKMDENNLILKAPMPGIIAKIYKKVGDRVQKGQAILAIETMKMQIMIRAAYNCQIQEIPIKEKQYIQANTALVFLQEIQ